jgi:hypothetical protein
MIYLGTDKGWVRMNLIPTALGDPVGRGGGGEGGQGGGGRGQAAVAGTATQGASGSAGSAAGAPARGTRQQDPNRINNGITGDARRSSAELGKKFIDMKVDYAVRQINQLLAAKPTGAGQ